MPDDFFEFLIATGQLDDFLGFKEEEQTDEEDIEYIEETDTNEEQNT